jgi:hypothetical protein
MHAAARIGVEPLHPQPLIHRAGELILIVCGATAHGKVSHEAGETHRDSAAALSLERGHQPVIRFRQRGGPFRLRRLRSAACFRRA